MLLFPVRQRIRCATRAGLLVREGITKLLTKRPMVSRSQIDLIDPDTEVFRQQAQP